MNTVKIKNIKAQIIAHRGLSGIEPENTAAAFIAAGNRSYYGIETDIYRTLDGRFAVNHDGNLKRVGGVDANIENSTLVELQSHCLYDKDMVKKEYLRVCALEDYICICKKYQKHCVLELKSDFTPEEIQKIIDIINDYDYIESVTFISFNYENLIRLKSILPNQSAQFLCGAVTDEVISMLAKDRIDLDVHYPCLTKENIEALHSANIKVNCWTVDSKEDAEKLAMWGVDFITSNILE